MALLTEYDSFGSSVSGVGLRFVTSSSLSRVFELGRFGFFILSPFRPDYDYGGQEFPGKAKAAGLKNPVSKENLNRFRRLQSELRSHGLSYIPLIGKWKDKADDDFQEELSVFVPYRTTPEPVDPLDDPKVEGLVIGSPELFFDFFMQLLRDYEQTSGIYGPPPKTVGEVPQVKLVFSGLRDEEANTAYDLGKFSPASVKDQYVSTLVRARRSNNLFKFDVGTELDNTMDTTVDNTVKNTVAASFSLGIGQPLPAWGGQLVPGVLRFID